ncbi:uncharacterized protein LOC114942457 [Nylanderia fulva]|uniref:uncharacterized protein LOC114942457 n=1 Tax=Nylanderia fulva TaxID=613905 RepID=UPI0010FB4FFE|nr:uncharacterized protein LOC114942457 [Nylanderia fulva]
MPENLTSGMSTLSASSVANLATSVGALGDIRQQYLEEQILEDQTNEETLKEKENEKENAEEKQKESKYKKFVKELLDMSLVKNWAFLNICFGVCFVSTADFDFSSFLPLITTKLGYTAQETELTVWINGIAELVSRVLLVSFTMIVDVKPKYLFFAGMILMGFAKLGFLLCEHTLKGVLITTALIGFVRAWLLVSQSIVIIDDVSIEKFASAYGFFGMISCLLSLTCSATVGLIITGNYDMYQVFLLVLQCTFIIPWALQFIFVHLRERRRPHAQNIII